eukprot:ANDGO_01697.mRNA.1 Ectoine dioxygenase
MAGLSAAEKELYLRDGFIACRNLISAEEIAEVMKACEVLANKRPAPGCDQEMMYYEDSMQNPSQRILSRIEKFVETNAVLAKIASDERILSRVADCLSLGREYPSANGSSNSTPILFKEKINFKLANGGRGFEAHQDIQPGWDDYAPYFVSVLVTIDPSTLENGCLELAGGHHKRGLLGEKWKPLTEDQLKGVEFVKFPTQPGDVVFFDCYVPHQSGPNMSAHIRRNMYLTYNHPHDGNHRIQYYADKRKAFPPDNERNGKQYAYKV